MLRPRFGEEQRAVREVEGGEPAAPRDGRAGRLPVQPSGDHQVQYGEVLAVECEDDALSQAPDRPHGAAREVRDGWLRRAEQERTRDADRLEPPSDDPRGERV